MCSKAMLRLQLVWPQALPKASSGLVTVLLTLFAASCSVKENRTLCPCHLAVQVSAIRSPPATLSCISTRGCLQVDIPGDTLFQVDVPRSRILVLAYAGVGEVPYPEEGFAAPEGRDFPPLYLASSWVDASCDSASVALRLRKQFCQLTLCLDGPPGWADPYWIEVRGSVCGVSASGAPLPGPFRSRLIFPALSSIAPATPATASSALSVKPGEASESPAVLSAHAGTAAPSSSNDSDETVSLCLPRQGPDAALWMDILMPDALVRSFNLGALLLDAGYDWSAPDLEDLDITLELSVTALTFRTPGWSRTVSLDLRI